jgi:surfactin synthase thioesterase subunit
VLASKSFAVPSRRAYATHRLFAFPPAGGTSSLYWSWARLLPEFIELQTAVLPGREGRIREAPHRSFGELVAALTDAMVAVADRPFALFGHSMGGIVAYEVARALVRRGGPVPDHVFVSAVAPPHSFAGLRHVARRTDEELVTMLRALDGTPAALLADPDLEELLVRWLRDDLALLASYRATKCAPLSVPLTVLGACDDAFVPWDSLAGWGTVATDVEFELFRGGHFYLKAQSARVTALVEERLRRAPLEAWGVSA